MGVMITKRGNSYQYKFEIASVGGKRKFKNKSGFATKAEAEKAGIIAYNEYINTGHSFKPSSVSYSDYLDYWLKEHCYINSKVAQNQEDYQKNYDALVKEYETTKVEHQKLELDISNKLAKLETLNLFINTIKKQDTLLTGFNAVMWGSLLESVTVYKADDIRFKFRDGTEIKG